jgi:hypothetical protein
MSRWPVRLASSILVGGSVAVAGGYYWHHYGYDFSSVSRRLPQSLRQKPASQAHLGDLLSLFSKDVILSALSDREVLGEINVLLLKAFKEAEVKQALKEFLLQEFTEESMVVDSLKEFLVDGVLADDWVKGKLIDLAKEIGVAIQKDKAIWDGPNNETLAMLGEVSLAALKTERFEIEARKAVKDALVKAIPKPL